MSDTKDMSLITPFITILMIILLCYFVSGLTKRTVARTEFPEDCTVTYKPRRTMEDKHLFEHEDPWLQKFTMSEEKREPDINHDMAAIHDQNKDKNVVSTK